MANFRLGWAVGEVRVYKLISVGKLDLLGRIIKLKLINLKSSGNLQRS